MRLPLSPLMMVLMGNCFQCVSALSPQTNWCYRITYQNFQIFYLFIDIGFLSKHSFALCQAVSARDVTERCKLVRARVGSAFAKINYKFKWMPKRTSSGLYFIMMAMIMFTLTDGGCGSGDVIIWSDSVFRCTGSYLIYVRTHVNSQYQNEITLLTTKLFFPFLFHIFSRFGFGRKCDSQCDFCVCYICTKINAEWPPKRMCTVYVYI